MKTYQLLWAAALILATTASATRGDEKRAVAALETMRNEVDTKLTITRDENQTDKPVIKVIIIGEVTDAGLKALAELNELKSLTIHTCRNVDAGLKGLGELRKLSSLELQGCTVTDVGRKEIAGLKTLRTLDLTFMPVPDAWLKEWAGFKELRRLNLTSTDVTDQGLKELSVLKELEELTLTDTRVTDQGAATLKRALPKCRIRYGAYARPLTLQARLRD